LASSVIVRWEYPSQRATSSVVRNESFLSCGTSVLPFWCRLLRGKLMRIMHFLRYNFHTQRKAPWSEPEIQPNVSFLNCVLECCIGRSPADCPHITTNSCPCKIVLNIRQGQARYCSKPQGSYRGPHEKATISYVHCRRRHIKIILS